MRESFNALDFPGSPAAAHHELPCQPPHEASTPVHDRRNFVLRWLADHVPESRLQHILRVETMAVELARHHGLDEHSAAQAGLMHDLAKYFKPAQLLEMAQTEGLTIDPIAAAHPHLLHADVGAIVARDQFGVKDPAVLAAIRNHTLGRPDMDALSCVVYLADALEPGRGDSSELAELRQLSYQHLAQAMWRTCDYTLNYLIANRQLIHPRTVQTRNWFLQTTIRTHAFAPKSSV